MSRYWNVYDAYEDTVYPVGKSDLGPEYAKDCPKDFKAIIDAEGDLVAYVPDRIAQPIADVLNFGAAHFPKDEKALTLSTDPDDDVLFVFEGGKSNLDEVRKTLHERIDALLDKLSVGADGLPTDRLRVAERENTGMRGGAIVVEDHTIAVHLHFNHKPNT